MEVQQHVQAAIGGGQSTAGGGGAGGGGAGGNDGSSGSNGSTNTGGGGGGGANVRARDQGKGIVILRFPSAFSITIGSDLFVQMQIQQ